MKIQAIRFLLRWLVNSIGLLVAADIFHLLKYGDRLTVVIIGGLLLSILNVLIKPVLVVISLPAIVITLGIFMVIVNGAVVYVTSIIYQSLILDSFWAATLVGIVIGLVNYSVTILAEVIEKHHVKYI